MAISYVAALFCVLGIAVGQILFKLSALAFSDSESLFSVKAASFLLSAMCLYGVTSLVWVWGLQKMELSRIYPLMALSFVFVPLGSHFVLGEVIRPQYIVGVLIIVIGIVVVAKA